MIFLQDGEECGPGCGHWIEHPCPHCGRKLKRGTAEVEFLRPGPRMFQDEVIWVERDEIKQIVGASDGRCGRPGLPGAWDLGGWCCEAKGLDIFDRLLELSRKFKGPLTCVELGVYEGKSLFCQAVALRNCPFGGFITGIDPYRPGACAEGFDTTDRSQMEHVEWWLKNSSLAAAEQRCRQEISARKLEKYCSVVTAMPDDVGADYTALHWLHLDDCHSPIVSLRNARAWVPKLLPGGLLLLDDADWPSMRPTRNWIAQRLTLLGEQRSENQQWETYRA